MDASLVLRALDPCASNLPLNVENDIPGFGDPWHAQAFGTSLALARAGLFTWEKWVQTFSAEIKAHPQKADETSDAAYYRQWLTALESLIGDLGTVSSAEISETAEHWRRSYLNTPHGKPIELSRAWPADHEHVDHHHHDHDHHYHHHGHHHHHHHDHGHHHHHGRPDKMPEPVKIDHARA